MGTRGCSAPPRFGRAIALWLRALSPFLLLLQFPQGKGAICQSRINEWMLCYIIKIVSTTDLPSTFLCYIKNKVSVHNAYRQLSCDDIWDTSQSILKLILSIFEVFFLTSDCNLQPSSRSWSLLPVIEASLKTFLINFVILLMFFMSQVQYFPVFSCFITATSHRLRSFSSDASWYLSNPR